jgi:hypothetical protein
VRDAIFVRLLMYFVGERVCRMEEEEEEEELKMRLIHLC